jgi:hypothetical protein
MSQIIKLFRSKTVWTPSRFNRTTLIGVALILGFPISIQHAVTQSGAHDPGVRGGPAGAGGFVAGLTQNQKAYLAARESGAHFLRNPGETPERTRSGVHPASRNWRMLRESWRFASRTPASSCTRSQ